MKYIVILLALVMSVAAFSATAFDTATATLTIDEYISVVVADASATIAGDATSYSIDGTFVVFSNSAWTAGIGLSDSDLPNVTSTTCTTGGPGLLVAGDNGVWNVSGTNSLATQANTYSGTVTITVNN